VQTTQGAHALHILKVTNKGIYRLLVDAVILERKFFQFTAAGIVVQIVGICHTGLLQHADHVGQHFLVQFTAELDIHSTACHIGGDGHRAKSAGFGDDLRFFIMFARVQYLVRYAAF